MKTPDSLTFFMFHKLCGIGKVNVATSPDGETWDAVLAEPDKRGNCELAPAVETVACEWADTILSEAKRKAQGPSPLASKLARVEAAFEQLAECLLLVEGEARMLSGGKGLGADAENIRRALPPAGDLRAEWERLCLEQACAAAHERAQAMKDEAEQEAREAGRLHLIDCQGA